MSGRYNKWLRQTLAERIRNLGGYNNFPISWSVPIYAYIDSTDKAIRLMVEHDHFLNEVDLFLQFPCFEEWFELELEHEDDSDFGNLNGRTCPTETDLWNEAQERLADDLTGNDDGMRMWSPDTAKKYGFEYEGLGADKPFDCKLGNYGRGGKHVCLEEFDGRNLKDVRNDDLATMVEGCDTYDNCSLTWCRRLMGMLDEWDEMFLPANVERAALYYQTDALARAMGLFD